MMREPAGQLAFEGLFVGPGAVPAPRPGNVGPRLRRALSDALTDTSRSTGVPRPRLAERIGELAGRPLTSAMLDRYAAPSCAEWRLPAEIVPAIVAATQDRRVIELLVEACGGRVLWGDEAVVAEMGALVMQERLARDRRRLLSRAVPAKSQAAVLSGLQRRLGAGDAR